MSDSTLIARPEGGSGPAGAALENTTDNSSAPFIGGQSDRRWWLLDWLRRNSVMKRQRRCMTTAYSDRVGVRQGQHSIGYGGLMACGSRACPVCGPNLYAQNRADLVQAVRAWREGEGGTVMFGTFTLRHHKGQSFELLKVALSECWAAVTSGRGWVRDRREHGVEHWVRVFEEKWSDVNGWHLHVHYLVFVRAGMESQSRALLESMFGRWQRAAVKQGLSAPVIDAQDLHEVDGDSAADVLGEYFTKNASATGELSAEALALELTMRDGKLSRKGRSYTPGELLTFAVAGDEEGAHLWAEYERGQHNRRVIAWSKGLRALVGIGDELSDQDAAQLEGEELRRTVLEMKVYAWRKLLAFGKRRELLQRVWDHGPERAVAWLSEWGVPAVVGTFDRYGEAAEPPEEEA